MSELFTNLARSTLASGITAGALTLTVQSGDGNDLFPVLGGSDNFRCVIFKKSTGDIEIINVTARSGDILTIARAQEQIGNLAATAFAFDAGDLIELRPTSAFFTGLAAGASSSNIQSNAFKYDSETGAADAYVITPNPAIAAYALAQEFWFLPSNTNTGASTLSVSGVATPPSIKMIDGTDPYAGALTAGRMAHVIYDGTNYVLLNAAERVIDIAVLGTSQASRAVTTNSSNEVGVGKAAVSGMDLAVNNIQAATGVLFGSDTASTNTLDDYEEGSFTPTLQDNSFSDAEGQTYSIQSGSYTKIGNMVFISLNMVMTSLGTLTGTNNANIAGLPFAGINSQDEYNPFIFTDGSNLNKSANESWFARMQGNNTWLRTLKWSSLTTGPSAIAIDEISANGVIRLAGWYRTNS